MQNDTGVETKTIKGDIQSKPRPGSTNEDLEVLPLGEVGNEVAAGGLGRLDTLNDGIGVNVVGTGGQEVVDILGCLLHVTLDIHGETGSLRDRKTEVEGDDSGNTAKTDEDTPHEVDMREDTGVILQERVLVGDDNNVGNKGTSKLTPSLVGEHCGHQTSTNVRRRELGGDDGGQRVVTTNADSHLIL